MFIHRKKREQEKAVQAAISKAKRTDKKEKSSQDSIPYLLMRQDGICQVTQNHYTKTIQFRDINYQLSDNEDKQAIFDSWCDFLNYFDSSVSGNHGAGASGRLIAARSQMVKGKTSGVPPPLTLCALPAEK